MSVPDVASVDVKTPKKGLFGGIFGSNKGKVEVGSVSWSQQSLVWPWQSREDTGSYPVCWCPCCYYDSYSFRGPTM